MAFIMQLTINKEIQIHPNIFSPSKYPCEGFFLVNLTYTEKGMDGGRGGQDLDRRGVKP